MILYENKPLLQDVGLLNYPNKPQQNLDPLSILASLTMRACLASLILLLLTD